MKRRNDEPTRVICPECGNDDKFTIWQESGTASCEECHNHFDYTEHMTSLLIMALAVPSQ